MSISTFKAQLEIIGVNPFVFVPEKILLSLFKQVGKEKGHIPVKGTINAKPYKQTLVKFKGEWRFYVNTIMLKNSPKRIGEIVEVTIEHDTETREIIPHPKLVKALQENKEANDIFKSLRPSLQHEIVRYISFLKTEERVDKNVAKAIQFLLGKQRFIGRAKP